MPVAHAAHAADPEGVGFDGGRLVVQPLTVPEAGDRWLLRTYNDVTVTGIDGVSVVYNENAVPRTCTGAAS